MMAPLEDDQIGVDFIDPLFAVALSLNFEELKKEVWFTDWSLILRGPHNFAFVTLALAWATVILSWVGYHRSIKTNPIRVRTLAGWWRFVLDVLLLIFYFVLLVSYQDFKRELRVLAIVFFLFILWDRFKKKEHPKAEYKNDESWNKATAQRGVTVVWFAFFLSLAIFYTLRPPQVRYECEDWIFLLSAMLGTVLYRAHKVKLWWPRIVGFLGF